MEELQSMLGWMVVRWRAQSSQKEPGTKSDGWKNQDGTQSVPKKYQVSMELSSGFVSAQSWQNSPFTRLIKVQPQDQCRAGAEWSRMSAVGGLIEWGDIWWLCPLPCIKIYKAESLSQFNLPFSDLQKNTNQFFLVKLPRHVFLNLWREYLPQVVIAGSSTTSVQSAHHSMIVTALHFPFSSYGICTGLAMMPFGHVWINVSWSPWSCPLFYPTLVIRAIFLFKIVDWICTLPVYMLWLTPVSPALWGRISM